MKFLPRVCRCLAALAAICSPLRPQATKGKQPLPPNACQLLPAADVVRVTGQKNYTPAESILGGYGCGYDSAQILLFTGGKAEQDWEETMKRFGHEKAERFPLAGVGEKAYSFYPKPRDQYEDTNAFVVVKQGGWVVAMSVAAPMGKTAQSVQPQALELAKIVLAKLK